MTEIARGWYEFLATLDGTLGEPLRALVASTTIGPLAALLLGILGALSPCQITTGIGAVALIGRRPTAGALVSGLAYAAGKATTYAFIGVLFITVGAAVDASAIPVAQVVRRLLGPLMLVVGLALLGVVHPRVGFAFGDRIARAAGDRLDPTRPPGAYALGVAFGFAFCPTLFLLFFGLLIPLALASPTGAVYPAIFALGTTLPVFVVLTLLWLGVGDSRGLTRRAEHLLTRLAGVIALLVGLSDTLVYWSL
jgi:cytochrome c-type biogenesis protein